MLSTPLIPAIFAPAHPEDLAQGLINNSEAQLVLLFSHCLQNFLEMGASLLQ